MNSAKRPFPAGEIGPLLVVLIWGLNFPLMKAVLAVMHPHAMNAIRIGCSTAVLALAHARVHRGRPFWAPFAERPAQLIAVGLLGYFAYQVAFIMGLSHTTAGSAALLMASAPVWTALLALVLGYDRLPALAWIGLAVSVVGTGLVVLSGKAQVRFGEEALLGNVIILGAAFCWGSYTALNRPLVARVHPVSLTFFAALVSMPALLAVGAPYLAATDWSRVSPLVWLAIIASGALSTGVATALWNRAVHVLGASHTAAFGNAVPVVAVAASALALSEPVSAGQILGGASILGGLALMRRARRPSALKG